ncbi:MAG: transglutaminase-like domain-containing protein [Lachnospiraceae bacterium]|nr:transglutaminase-like domain-containing protein [Lachnospiraceae bacterium]
MKDELYDFIYRTVFTAVTALFIFFEIYNYSDPGAVSRANVLTVIVVSLSFNALLLLYRKVRFYIFPALFAVALIFWLAVDKEALNDFFGSVAFSMILIGLAAFVIFLICDRIPVLAAVTAGGVFVFMLVELIMGYNVYPASPALAAFYAMAVLIRVLRNRFRADAPARTRKYITFLLPFLLLYLLLLLAMPKPAEPVSWDWVQRMYETASKRINRLIHRITTQYGVIDSNHFKISFDMDKSMSYDSPDDYGTELFEITPHGSMIGSLYLRGEIFNEFSSGEWHNTLQSSEDYFLTDSLETRKGVENYGEMPGNFLLREASIKVRFLDIVSPIVFTPAKPLKFLNVSSDRPTNAVNEHLLFNSNMSYGSDYIITFLQMNIGNDVFTDYMNSSSSAATDRDGLHVYRDYIDTYYRSEPQIRDSVRKWLDAVTAGAGSDYEKLLAVEHALSGFAYNIKTDSLPDYVQNEGDFIDHFILEKQEGYCVHYATVFCLIARYMGYPSRVIRGYKTELNVNTPTVVTDHCGHSWPEVYFAGKGWIPFEPTPGMSGDRYDGWAVKSKHENSGQASAEDTAKPTPDIPLPEEDAEYLEEHREKSVSWLLMLAIAGVILLSILLLLIVRILLKHGRLKRMNAQERYYHEFDMVMYMLSDLGMKRSPDETFEEYAEKSGISLFGKCAAVHESFIYGGRIPTEDHVAALTELRSKLDKMMREKFGRTYFLHRLKMMIEE